MYRGDTPGKVLARLHTWELAAKYLRVGKRPPFDHGEHLVLAGPDGGDISVALGMGVAPGRILAFEMDREAFTKASWRFPEVRFFPYDAAKTQNTPVFAFLDFCSQICDNIVNASTAVLKHMSKGGLMAVTFLVGREQGEYNEQVMRLVNQLKNRDNANAAYHGRCIFLLQQWNKKRAVSPVASIFYESARDTVGMLTMGILVVQVEPDKSTQATAPVFFFGATPKDLGKKAIELEKHGRDSSLLLNATKGTVAAWKAHATRGTYKEEKK